MKLSTFISWIPILIGPLAMLYNYMRPAPGMVWPDWRPIAGIFLAINLAYNVCNWILRRYSGRYRQMSDSRKAYTIKNIVKSIYLAWLSVYITPSALDTLDGNWNNYNLHIQSIMYSIPDLVGVLRVPNLRMTTYIHHAIVIGLPLITLRLDYTQDIYWKWHVIYGYLSALTFIVNLFMGTWRLFKPGSTVKWFAKISMVNYTAILAINWTWQVYWLVTHISYTHIPTAWEAVYVLSGIFLIFAIAVDDIDLENSLLKHARGKIISSLDKKEKEELEEKEIAASWEESTILIEDTSETN